MARVLIVTALGLPFLQLVTGQTPSFGCRYALAVLSSNIERCTPSVEHPYAICSGRCEHYYQRVMDQCAPQVICIHIHLADMLYISYVLVMAESESRVH